MCRGKTWLATTALNAVKPSRLAQESDVCDVENLIYARTAYLTLIPTEMSVKAALKPVVKTALYAVNSRLYRARAVKSGWQRGQRAEMNWLQKPVVIVTIPSSQTF